MKAPSVERRVLVLVAGAVWSVVGLILVGVAILWLMSSDKNVVVLILVGIISGTILYRYGFRQVARINLIRIYEQAPGKDKICVFSFQNIRSYLIAVSMMLMGYTLRHLPIPKVYLAPLYLAIGLGLFLSSLHYYMHLCQC
jgi:hypothetical protein